MPNLPSDFVQPKGLLQEVWFEDVDASVIAWLVEAVSKTAAFTDTAAAEAAQVAWVYYRAYQSLYEEAILAPAEQRTQETWDRWAESQIKELGRMAQAHLQDYFRIANRELTGQDYIPVVSGRPKLYGNRRRWGNVATVKTL